MKSDIKDITVTSMDKRIHNIIDILPRKGHFAIRLLKDISQIIVHHSASKTGQFSMTDFANWHISPTGRLKAPAICYHLGIEGNGEIYQVNTLYEVAWHAGYAANQISIGIELNGNFEIEEPTSNQLASLEWLICYLQDEVMKKKLTVLGHKEVQVTACPGKNLMYKSNLWKI